jgi:hypothetical protein
VCASSLLKSRHRSLRNGFKSVCQLQANLSTLSGHGPFNHSEEKRNSRFGEKNEMVKRQRNTCTNQGDQIGRFCLFTLGTFLTLKKQHKFRAIFHGKRYNDLTKNGLGYILGDFFTIAYCHTGTNPLLPNYYALR